jgi:nitroimidazol reductase NimA-like FMN-containing flavoprotein (pyridoxamine 5'-phosphate oxidase superfamily)
MQDDTIPPFRVLDDLAAEEALALMATVAVGRVVFTLDALPAILPVAFGFDDHTIAFRLVSDQRVHAALHDCVCAFEADAYDPDEYTGWTVTVTGRVTRVESPEETGRLAALLPRAWESGHPHQYFRVVPEMVTGRLLRGSGDPLPV